jgi:hypothetical protein
VADTFQFVDSIASSPTVRLDLNNENPWAVPYGASFSPPSLKRASASTLMRDGATYPASAYEDRRLRFTLELKASTVDASATAIQALAREMDRPTNIIRWQVTGATAPVFFRTIRSDIGSIEEVPGDGTFRVFQVELLAEPFAYGLKETLSPTTVSNHPGAGGVTPGYWDITGVKGDVETPLIASVSASVFAIANDNVSVFAVRRRGTPSNWTGSIQAESMTLGTDTTLPGNDGAMSGAGSNYARCSFGTTTAMATRLSATHPAAASVDNRGTCRVFARVRRSVGGTDVVRMQLRWGGAAGTITNDAVATAQTTNIGYVDLGLIQLPPGQDPVDDGFSGTKLSVAGVFLEVRAERTSGTSNLDIDYLLLLPADDRMLFVRWGTQSGGTTCVVDGANQKVYQLNAGGAVVNANLAQLSGGFPMLSPNQTNRIWFYKQVRFGAPVDSVGNTYDVTASYYPRYLYVRPAST